MSFIQRVLNIFPRSRRHNNNNNNNNHKPSKSRILFKTAALILFSSLWESELWLSRHCLKQAKNRPEVNSLLRTHVVQNDRIFPVSRKITCKTWKSRILLKIAPLILFTYENPAFGVNELDPMQKHKANQAVSQLATHDFFSARKAGTCRTVSPWLQPHEHTYIPYQTSLLPCLPNYDWQNATSQSARGADDRDTPHFRPPTVTKIHLLSVTDQQITWFNSIFFRKSRA